MKGAPKARVSSFPLLLLLSALALVLPSSSHSADPLRIDALAPMEVVAEGFQEPMGVIGAAGGAILVSDRKAGRVFSVTAEDKQPLVSGLKRPVGLSFDAEGRLLIVEEATGRLLRLEPGGALTVVAQGMTKPRWVAMAVDGTLYLSARGIDSQSDAEGARTESGDEAENDDEAQGEMILRIGPTEEVSVWVDGFKGLEGLLIHGATVFAAARGRKHESDEHGAIFQIPVLADGSAGPVSRLTQGVIKKPVGLALDGLGALYMSAEEINSQPKDKAVIAKVGSGGALTRFAAKLEKPRGMALDSEGNLDAADGEGTAHGRLLRFRAPPPPAVAAPAFTNQSPLTLTGTTEAHSRIDAFVNDTPVPIETLTEDGSFGLAVLLRLNAQNSVAVFTTAHNGEGLTSAPTEVTILHDDVAPRIANLQPPNGAFRNTAQPLIRADFTDTGAGIDPSSVVVNLDGVSVTAQARVTAAGFTLTPGAPLAEGRHTVSVTVADRAGNAASASGAFTVDVTAPRVSNLTPAPGSVVTTASPTIRADFSDTLSGINLASVRILLDGVDRTSQAAISASGFTLDGGPLSEGSHTASVALSDLAGNAASASSTFTVSLGPHPPVLNPIGNQTVALGTSLVLQLTATSPDGRPLTFLAVPLPLPANASLNAQTGLFRFTPGADQVGSFPLTFIVSDGRLTDSEAITVTVTGAPPGGTTALTGRLLDTNDFVLGRETPVVNATVSLLGTGRATSSDASGRFTLTGVPSGIQVIDIATATANPAPDGSPYAGFREQHELIEGVTNVVDRPFFLPRIARESLTTVDPGATTVVANPTLRTTMVVPPNTAKNVDGTNFTGQLSISQVAAGLTPAALPADLEPGLIITIQPVGVTFATPVPITFPNTDNLSPGSETDIWSLDARTGRFAVVGTGRVSADGSRIETISGGIRAADWHFALPPAASGGGAGDGGNQGGGCGSDFGSRVILHTGCLGTDFSLPTYVSLGTARALTFSYKSVRANPQPVIPFDATILVRAAVPPKLSYELTLAGVAQGRRTFVNTSGLDENRDETIRAAVSFDASSLGTGAYPYSLRLTSHYGSSGISSRISDRSVVVNDQRSPFGAGWGLAGLQRLHVQPDQSVVLTDGGGTALLFTPGSSVTPPPPGGVVSWWPGDGNANDTVGSNSGTLRNGATFAPGQFGGAFSFDGVDDFVQATDLQLPLGSAPRTLEFWMKPVSNARVPVIYGDFAPSNAFYVVVQASSACIGQWGGGPLEVCGSTNVIDGRWHHVAMTYDGGTTASLYVDGLLEVTVTKTYATTSTGKLYIGSTVEGSQEYYRGGVDEVRIYNRALSAVEIRAVSSPGGSRSDAAADFSLASNPNGLWSYGAATSLGSITLYTVPDEPFPGLLERWHIAPGIPEAFGAPSVNHNKTNDTLNVVTVSLLPRQLTFHPGPNGEFGVIRWTAPAPGNYDVNVAFSGRDVGGTTTDVHVLKGATELFIDNINGFGDTRSFSTRLMLAAGDTIDFAVGFGGNGFFNDTTSIDATIAAAGLPSGPTAFRGPAGDFSSLVRNGDGSFGRTLKDGTQIRFDTRGLQTAVVDRNGNTTTYSYDTSDHLASITDPVGLVTALAYAGDHLSTINDTTGRVTRFEYDSAGNLTHVTFPDQSTRSFAYDDRHLMTAETNARGFVTTREYNHVGRVVRTTLPDGSVRQATSALTVGLVDPASGQGTEASPAVVRRPADAVSTLTDGEGRTFTISTGRLGEAASMTDPIGLTRRLDRDTDGNPIRTVLPNGAVITEGYDLRGNLVSVTDETVGGTQRLTYEATFNQVTSIRDPKGHTTTFEYDSRGNRTRTVTPGGRVTTAAYDTRGLVTSAIDALGTPTIYTYDAAGRLTQVVQGTGPDQRVAAFTYTPEGYLASVTDPLGRTSHFSYDVFGRLTRRTLPDARIVAFGYDQVGNLASVTPPGRPAHALTYTPVDLEAGYVPPEVGAGTKMTVSEYNAAQQMSRITRPDGVAVSFAYDAGGRVSAVTLPRGTIAYSYDPASGNPSSTTAPDGITVSFTHQADLLRAEAWTGAAVTGNVSRAYDVRRRVISRAVNGGTAITFDYDADARLMRAGDLSITRAPSGLITGTTLGTLTDTFTRNQFGEIVSYSSSHSGAVLYDVEYTRDQVGRIVNKTETVAGVTASFGYAYDLAGRLTDVTKNGNLFSSYSYDANGNRLRRTGPSGILDGQYDDQDRLRLYGDAAYTYTANGELASTRAGGQTTTYQYDELGNLLGVTLPSGARIDYIVDGNGRRLGKKIDGVLHQAFLYKDKLRAVAELDASNKVVSLFIYATRDGAPDYMIREGITYRIVADHLGSPRVVVDAVTGTIAQRMDYDEFGNVLLDTNPGFQPFGFAGGIYDADTKLTRFGVRDYDAETGRWTMKDPIRFVGGDTNLYRYVGNDPVQLRDPSGLRVLLCSRKAQWGPVEYGNHAYLWDERNNQFCGLGSSTYEAGPGVDYCNDIPGSDGKEDQIMDCCFFQRHHWPIYIVGANDCHTLPGNCIRSAGLSYTPSAPGGRWGIPPCDDCSKPPSPPPPGPSPVPAPTPTPGAGDGGPAPGSQGLGGGSPAPGAQGVGQPNGGGAESMGQYHGY